MIAEQHIVEKVKVDIDVESVELAEKIKSEINDFIQDEVLSIVEEYFDNLDLPQELKNKTIQLDRVDLSVDTSSWSARSSQLKQEIRSEVEKQMDPIVEKLKEKNVKHDLSLATEYDDIREENVHVYSKEERVLKSIFYFLDHGTLPWWVKSVEESRELFSEDSMIITLREQATLAKKEFDKRRNNPRFRKRLVQQFPVSVVSEMIQISLSKETSQLKNTIKLSTEEIENLPKNISSKVLSLVVELSAPQVIEEVFRKDSSRTLFKYIHSQFFSATVNKKRLESTLKATKSALRVLYLFGGKESEWSAMLPDFKKSLDKHLSSDVLTPLKETKTYQKLFLSLNSITDESETSQPSNLKSSSERNQETTDDAELTGKFAGEDIESISQSQKEEHEVSHDEVLRQEEVNANEILSNEPNESVSKEEEQSSEDQLLLEKIGNEKVETEKENEAINKLKDQSIDSLNEEVSTTKESVIEDEISHLNLDSESTGNEVNPKRKNDEDSSEITDKKDNKKEAAENDLSKKASQKLEKQQAEEKKKKIEAEANQNLLTKSETSEPQMKETGAEKIKDEREELSQILEKRTENSSNPFKKGDKMPNQLFVENAGLVLLNPFITPLFKHLDLLDDKGKLTNPDLAACILHYAATGREGDFEFEMTFEKYLCGIPPAVSVDREITLTEAHKNEVEKVLNSVLEHWTSLKSKSTALLQNEFLTRSGKLIVETSSHRLIVEKKTFDLLLDKLPWSYSLIKFSWNKELIFVEW